MNTNGSFRFASVLAALAAALAVPVLPLRISASCALLTFVLAVLPVRANASLRLLLLCYLWFWMVGCVVAAGQALPAVVLMIAIALAFPSTLAGLRRQRVFSTLPDIGVITGAAVLVVIVLGLSRIPPFVGAVAVRPIMQAVLGSVLAYFAVRGAALTCDGTRLHRIGLLAAIIPLLSLTMTGGWWFISLVRAKHCEAQGNIGKAMLHAQVEESWARSLDVHKAVAHAVHRQAEFHLQMGRRQLWREALKEAVKADPHDYRSLSALLQDSLLDATRAEESLRYFPQLPPSMIDRKSASAVVPLAFAAERWLLFERAWRLGRGSSLTVASAGIDLARAGKALFFLGRTHIAQALLEKAVADGRADWPAVRMLCMLHLSAGRSQAAIAILDSMAAVPREEKHYLQSRISGTRGTEVGIVFEGKLRLIRCHTERSSVTAGGILRIAFSWQALAPVNPEWRVFVHVRRNAADGYFFQGDHRFGEVAREVEEWPLGTVTAYDLPVKVPSEAPTGDYAVIVGVWDGQTNRRPDHDRGAQETFTILRGGRVDPGLRVRVAQP